MFEGFKHVQIQTSDPEVKTNLRYGGSGPPVLLLGAMVTGWRLLKLETELA